MAKNKNQKDPRNHVVATNRKARHDYEILETFEAGMVLAGTEVKSLREGKASLAEGFAVFYRGELWAEMLYIPEYLNGSWTNHAARRRRKLLLHRKELIKLERRIDEAGLTIVPLKLYFVEGRAKLEIGLVRGKKDWDKRHALKEKQDNREAMRALRERNRRAGVS